jgi:dUTP pyrophosphatase
MEDNSYDLLENDLNNLLSKLRDELDELDNDNVDEIDGISMKELESAYLEAQNNVTNKLNLSYTKISEDAIDPQYAYESDSGFDLWSVEEVHFLPFERKLVPTGLSFDIPEGYEIQVRTKSGLAIKQGLMVLNSPGTVDQGYTGEVKVILMNMNNYAMTVTKNQKIAQAVLCPVVSGKWINLVSSTSINQKERGSNGFGSTGI